MMSDLLEIIPHRPPLVLIDALLECSANRAVAARVYPPDGHGTREGLVLQGALIESLAQTAAALFGHNARANGPAAGGGMLVGVSDFRFLSPVRCGEPLRLTITITRELPPFALAEGQIYRNETLVAGGTLKFYVSGGRQTS